jgi:hypothetical protein
MRFAILPLVIHRKSQFGPADNDVLIQVAPFRCTLFVSSDAVQAFLQAFVNVLALAPRPATLGAIRRNGLGPGDSLLARPPGSQTRRKRFTGWR